MRPMKRAMAILASFSIIYFYGANITQAVDIKADAVKPAPETLDRGSAETLLAKGTKYFANRQFEEAINEYSMITNGLAGYQIAANDIAARAQLQIARSYYELANILEKRNNLGESIIKTEKAREAMDRITCREAPDFLLGNKLKGEGRYREAVEAYERLLAAYPKLEFANEVYLSIAECHYSSKGAVTDPVLSAVEMAISSNPSKVLEYDAVTKKALQFTLHLSRQQNIDPPGIPVPAISSSYIEEVMLKWADKYPQARYLFVCRGLVQEQRAQYDKAIEAYQKYIQRCDKSEVKDMEGHINSVMIFQKASRYLSSKEDRDKAAPLLKEVSGDNFFLSPVKEEALRVLAHYEYQKGGYDEVISLYNQILNAGLTVDPAQFFSLLTEREQLEYIRSLSNKEKNDAIIRILTAGTAVPVKFRLLLADSYYKTGDYKNGYLLYRRIAKAETALRNPGKKNDNDRVEINYKLGKCLFGTGHSKKAVKTLLSLSHKYPSHRLAPYALYDISTYYQDQEMYDKAVSGYGLILMNYPKSDICSHAIYQIGKAYFAREDYAKAKEEWQKAATLYPESDIIKEIRKEISQIDLETAAAIPYKKAEARYEEISKMDWRYTNVPLYNDVVSQADQIVNAYPDTAAAIKSQYLIIQCYEQQMEDVKTGEAVKKYIDMLFKTPPAEKMVVKALLGFSDNYFKEEKYSQAKDIYAKLISAYPANPSASYTQYKIADCFQKLGKNSEAIAEYNKLIKNYPNSKWQKESYNKMGDCYALLGEAQEAFQSYQKGF